MSKNNKDKGKRQLVPAEVVAIYTESPVVIDGKLDDSVWKRATRYNLSLSKDRRSDVPQEGGEVMLAWDDEFLYIGAYLIDSDIIQTGEEDQMHFYTTGDVLEVFLKPEKEEWYWELYGTPNNKKTVFWFPSRKFLGIFRNMDRWTKNMVDIKVATQIEGTLNNSNDRDRYWTIELSLPVRNIAPWYMFTPRQEHYFGPGSEWRILISRYNYSKYLKKKELSMFPQLSQSNFHFLEEYGIIRFEK
ncbi:MAG: carbohydrate-binding family 9-like protein [Candidatus Ratteibacteria bacterium]|nr:carbohydrate-binding family 9-like protein [Candidatus Ratteibacteria bacterium]